MSENVIVHVAGIGLLKDKNGISNLRLIEAGKEFTDPIEFGKFLGRFPNRRIEIGEERSAQIPEGFHSTWSITQIDNMTEEKYQEWALDFSQSQINQNGLTDREVLLFWLQHTQDERIINLLIEE